MEASAKIAQAYQTHSFALADGRVFTGFVISEGVRAVLFQEASGAPRALTRQETDERLRQDSSAMRDGITQSLTPEQPADLVACRRTIE